MSKFEAIICSKGSGISALHIVRELGRMGINIHLITDNLEKNLGSYSKYCSKKYQLSSDYASEFFSTLEKIISSCSYPPVLYIDNDLMLKEFTLSTTSIKKRLLFPNNTVQVKYYLDKKNQISDIKRLGIDTPKTWFPNGWKDIIEIKSNRDLIVKKRFPIEARKDTFKVLKGKDGYEIVQQLRGEPIQPHELMVQEFIEGDDKQVGIAMCYSSRNLGKPIIVTGRKILQSGQGYGGIMVFGKAYYDKRLYDLSYEIISKLNIIGFIGLEFKLSNSKCFFIEMNMRPERINGLASAAGLPLELICYNDLSGGVISSTSFRKRLVNALWIDDTKFIPILVKQKKITPLLAIISAITYRKKLALFARDDIMPWKKYIKRLL